MNKNKKGFSLAELLIALLIISVVLSAAIPTITKKNAKSSEKIWRWANQNNSIYAAVGGNQTVLIGADQKAYGDDLRKDDPKQTSLDLMNKIFTDGEIKSIMGEITNITNRFTTSGDKLVLFKQAIEDPDSIGTDNLINSHISFYNLVKSSENEPGASENEAVKYVGRIAADEHNLAFGIGSLQNSFPISDEYKGYNTALGHYAAFSNSQGEYNTAVGEKALTNNFNSDMNTAVGYHSLFTLALGESTNNDENDEETVKNAGHNTAIGSYSMQGVQRGAHNTALGYMSLGSPGVNTIIGNFNTALGSGACHNVTGNNNICIGYNAGSKDNLTDENYGFYLGGDQNGIPLMYGNMNANDSEEDLSKRLKNLNFNVDVFQVNSKDASSPVLIINSSQNKVNRFYFITDGNLGENNGMEGSVFSISKTSQGEILLDTHDNSQNSIDNNTARNMVLSNRLFFNLGQTDIAANKSLKTASITGINEINNININNIADFIYGSNETQFILKNNKLENSFKIAQENDDTKVEFTGNLIFTKTGPANNGITFFGNGKTNPTIALMQDGDIYLKTLQDADSNGYTQGGFVHKAITYIWQAITELQLKVNTPSDIRLKENISDNNAGLKEINALQVKNYRYKKDKTKTPHVGVIAQQLQKTFPNAVTKDKDGYLQIRHEDIFYAMVNSIKELFAKIQDLTAKITGLDKRLTELEKENAQLKKQNAEFEKRLSKLEKASK